MAAARCQGAQPGARDPGAARAVRCPGGNPGSPPRARALLSPGHRRTSRQRRELGGPGQRVLGGLGLLCSSPSGARFPPEAARSARGWILGELFQRGLQKARRSGGSGSERLESGGPETLFLPPTRAGLLAGGDPGALQPPLWRPRQILGGPDTRLAPSRQRKKVCRLFAGFLKCSRGHCDGPELEIPASWRSHGMGLSRLDQHAVERSSREGDFGSWVSPCRLP